MKNQGVLQGGIRTCNILPLHFSFLVNDCKMEFLSNGNTPVKLQELNAMQTVSRIYFSHNLHSTCSNFGIN